MPDADPEHTPDADALADALDALPADEREAVIAHVHALAHLSPKRRAAILTLTDAT